MLAAHTAIAPGARSAESSTPFPGGPAVRQIPPHAEVASGLTSPSTPERQTKMLLLHEALARAQCSDRSCDRNTDRLAMAEAARVRERHLRAARARRRLDIALRRLERAASDADRAEALASASA